MLLQFTNYSPRINERSQSTGVVGVKVSLFRNYFLLFGKNFISINTFELYLHNKKKHQLV